MKNFAHQTTRTAIFAYSDTHTFWFLAIILGLGVFLYAHFLNSAVVAVIEREHFTTRATDLQAEISELEFSYIALQSNITLEHARVVGFVESADAQFISRASVSDGALTANPIR